MNLYSLSISAVLILVVCTFAYTIPAANGLVREYYIVAETTDWDYSNGQAQSSEYIFKKIIYKEYEQSFSKPIGSKVSGILGPTLRVEIGDTLKVHFKNMATKPLTIHPQGILYGKRSEGANYNDGTSSLEKLDDAVLPGQTYTYSWDITENMGPKEDDPDCLTNIYYSAENMVQDVNSGLIGALLICKTGSLNEDGTLKNFNRHFIVLFAVFDENKSLQALPSPKPRPVIYTINGYMKDTGPDFKACVDDKISWHLIAMSSKPELFSVHFFGQTLEQNQHRISVLRLASSASMTANMTVTQSGRWAISSLNEKHIEAGMQSYLDVQTCGDRERTTRKKSVFQTRYIKSWEYYIAAVEVDWDYTHGTSDNSERTACHQMFKKVIYKRFLDNTFTTQASPERSRRELGLLGPVIRAQVKDTIMVIFKNMASQPHNIYPQGISLQRFLKGVTYDQKGEELQNNTVMPGETVTYYWTVLDNDQPTRKDTQCLTRIYHSTVNIVKDMASGLLGTLLICKHMSLDTRGLQEKADEEQIAMFAVFDENKSWYYESNKPKACSWMLTKDPITFYNSFVISTINGNTFEKAILSFCHTNVVHWHISSVGIWDETLILQLSGHIFKYKGQYKDLVTLFPMTSESITMEMNNQGVWIFGIINFKENPALKMRFKDAKCVSDYDYEYVIEDTMPSDSNEVVDRAGSKDISDEMDLVTDDVEDDYTENLAAEFDIRSLKAKNNTYSHTEETVNLTALAIDMYESSNEDVFLFSKTNKSEISDEMDLVIDNVEDNYNENLAAQFDNWSLKAKNNTYSHTDETVNRTALAIDDMYESSNEDVFLLSKTNKSEHYKIESFEATEDTYTNNITDREEQDNQTVRGLDTEHIPTSTSSFSEEFSLNDTLKIVVSNQTNITLNRKDDTYLPVQNATDSESEENRIWLEAENRFSPNVDESANDNQKNNGSDASKLIRVAKRYVKRATHFTEMNLDLKHVENKTEETETAILENVSEAQLSKSQFMEKLEVSSTSQPMTDYEVKSESPHIGMSDDLNKLPGASPTLTSNSHSDYTTSKARDEVPSATIALLHTTGRSIYDSHDTETEELLGAEIFEDIMKAIFHQPQMNETDMEVEQSQMSAIQKTDDFNKLHNHSLISINNITQQASQNETKRIPKIIYVKRMERFQIEDAGNNISIKFVKYVRKQKRVGKNKEKRTINSIQNKLHNKTQSDLSDYVSSNSSLDNGNIAFSPRGFNPRSFHQEKRQIVIGIPSSINGEYEEHDTDSMLNYEEEEQPKLMVEFEEPYKTESADDVSRYTNPDRIIEHYMRSATKGTKRVYYIAAKEVQWDYSGKYIRYNVNEKPVTENRGTVYKKVVFQRYLDGTFTKPDVDGEYEEHLGILGPVIRAEVEDVIQVVFKNLATRPYSIHAHGVSYEKSSEGYSYADETEEWLKKDDIVKPGESHVYVWYATENSGPETEESACKTWAYHSGVDLEKDIHSGLIGPLLICRSGTLHHQTYRPLDAREFVLLFMTFEEEKSWYFDKVKQSCTDISQKPLKTKCHTYHAINGIIYNLQGLQMYQDELVRWHMLNMGNPRDVHVINFHGQTVTERLKTEHRLSVFPLEPGSFATVEMKPARAGLWQLGTEVAEYQQAGMQAIFNIAETGCNFPLGLESKLISDDQITASHYIDYWEPRLARLNNAGSYNAWSAHMNKSSLPWIQVDLQKTVLISGIQTQGARKYLVPHYITEFFVVYSKDKRKWTAFKGNSTALHKVFQGNVDYSGIKENQFDPPIAARYIRVYPTKYYNKPALRMELLGCEIQGCSSSLGMENNAISDNQITASSYKSSWFSSWLPSLARLNKAGSVNAWQAKSNNNQQWLQIDFLTVKKITGITTQGARQFTSEMYVQSYSIQYSDNGKTWKAYIDGGTSMEKIFKGNSNGAGYFKNEFNPPIYSRFLRIVPKGWNQSIVMRVELYGCDT
ncbi:coagulation factor V [Hyperolius riggenbachi]|uniref:coagulation factor V n=1 Tax=Hyperolius riggenbachi TaxID=752182 RepID=UPI0035A37ADB